MEQPEEDRKSEETISDVPWFKSCRFVLAIISAFGYTFFYILRIDLSMAIVCMIKDPISSVDPSSIRLDDNHSSTWTQLSLTTVTGNASGGWTDSDSAEADRCVEAATGSNRSGAKGELEWNKELRGYVLGSFFYGYLVTQVPGGWLASRYGGKHVFGGGVLITLIATLLVPVAARAHANWVILLRVIMGLACGVGFPATHHLYSLWVPPLERSKTMTFSYAGTMIGTIFALLFSGILCDVELDNGWPLIFYVYGGVAFIWWIFWNLLVYNSPLEHPRIDPVERRYITSLVDPSVYESHKESDIPWRSIITSGPMWAIIVAHCCNNWTNYTILVCAPTYMKEVLKFDVKQNGALSALPYVFAYFISIGSGLTADFLIARRIFSIKVTRKFMQSISSTVPAITLVALGYVDCGMRHLAVVLLCLTVGISACCRAGFLINHVDIAPRHSGILFGISNTGATVPGILAPIVVGLLTKNGSREEWLMVFYICAGLFAFSTVVYIVFADGQPQKWSLKHPPPPPPSAPTAASNAVAPSRSAGVEGGCINGGLRDTTDERNSVAGTATETHM